MHLTHAQERALIVTAQSRVTLPEVALAARNTLIERNTSLIWKLCVNYAKRRGGEAKEYVSTATFAYIRCIDRIDLSRGWRLSSYAAMAIENALNTAARREAHLIRVPNMAQVHAHTDSHKASPWLKDDAKRAMQPNAGLTAAFTVAARKQEPRDVKGEMLLKKSVKRMLQGLSEARRDVVERLLRGETFGEIAAASGICKQTAYQRYADAIGDLRRLLGVNLET